MGPHTFWVKFTPLNETQMAMMLFYRRNRPYSQKTLSQQDATTMSSEDSCCVTQ